MIADRAASFEQIHDILVFPAPRPDQNEFWGLGALAAHKFASDMQQQEMILARFDGPTGHKVGWPRHILLCGYALREDRRRRNWRDEHRHVSPAELRQMAPQGLFHNPRRHDSGRAEMRQIRKAAQMNAMFDLAEIFGIFERQQVMNEKNAFDVLPSLQPAKIARNSKRKLADIEIARTFRQGGGRRLADRNPMPPDRSDDFRGAPSPPAHDSPRALVLRRGAGNPRHDAAIAFVFVRASALAPMIENSIHNIRRGRSGNDARALQRQHYGKTVGRWATCEMAREGEINPIDAVWRSVEEACRQSRNIVGDRTIHHEASIFLLVDAGVRFESVINASRAAALAGAAIIDPHSLADPF